MLGDTISLTIGGTARVLSKINEGNGASEYYLKIATGEFRARIKHSKDRIGGNALSRDRHVITLSEKVYPTPTTFELNRSCSITIVGDYLDDAGLQADLVVGLEGYVTKANAVKLIGYEV